MLPSQMYPKSLSLEIYVCMPQDRKAETNRDIPHLEIPPNLKAHLQPHVSRINLSTVNVFHKQRVITRPQQQTTTAEITL